jgi:hypothetical protein
MLVTKPPALVDGERQLSYGFEDLRLTDAAVTDNEGGRPESRVRAIGTRTAYAHRATRGRRSDGFLVELGVQLDHQVQTGGDAMDRKSPQALVQGDGEHVAATAIHGTRASEMAVQFTSIQEFGEGQLLEGRRPAVRLQLCPFNVRGEVRREEQPPDPQCGRQHLGRRPYVHDTVWSESLQRTIGWRS